MVVFLTFFLGLTAGTRPLQLQVDEAVYRVEIVLDGAVVGGVAAEPWRTQVAFGDELLPHTLEAVAYDADGVEVGRARQAINRPRDPAEASLLLTGGANGRGVSAELHWSSLFAAAPIRIHVVFDGIELPIDTAGRIALPDHDPDQLHFLRADLDFPDNVRSMAEIAFGGVYGDEVNTDLTAVPVILDVGVELPAATELQGWFVADGQPLTVVAVEKGPAEVVVVVDQGALPRLDQMARMARSTSRWDPRARQQQQQQRSMPIRKDTILRFITPFIAASEDHRNTYELFPRSADLSPKDGGFFWHLSHQLPQPSASPQRLADAIAVAALSASQRNRRRHVILLISDQPADGSRWGPATVRTYLRAMRVPLSVWTTEKAGDSLASGWGESSDVTTLSRLGKAVLHLRKGLEQQRIVWLRGDHLPTSIGLSPAASGVQLAE